MGLARACSVAHVGVQGHVVEVEAHIGVGLPAFTLVGLPDAALHEARDRVRAAVVNSGERWPQHRLTVGLSPATLPKAGSHFDLAIAMAVVAAAGELPGGALDSAVFVGELGLDGRMRRVRGVLPAILAASQAGYHRFVVPEPNAAEACLVEGAEVLGVRSLRQLLALCRGVEPPEEPAEDPVARGAGQPISPGLADRQVAGLDLADVAGQLEARKALEVAAAGGHHVSLTGPPGAGKTMLAERLPGLLPRLEPSEALEVTAIHSVAGVLPEEAPLVTEPPFCDPHHSASLAAVVGGGSRPPRPGAVSLAHRGALFLDEAPEFKPAVLDALRQPLEHGEVVIARAFGAARFPAGFQLVLAANPCPCGLGYGRGLYCTCSSQARRRYRQRLSGPIRDRIDITCLVAPVSRADMIADRSRAESSAVVAERVREARRRQHDRYRDAPWRLNAHVPGPALRRRWPAVPESMRLVESQLVSGRISARGVDRVLRLAWTLADLAARDRPGLDEVHHAMTLRLGHDPGPGRDQVPSVAGGRRAG